MSKVTDAERKAALHDAAELWAGAGYDLQKVLDCVDAALEAAYAARWQPIETAPSDGSRILATVDGHVDIYLADGNWWRTQACNPPTHWQPLASPPGERK